MSRCSKVVSVSVVSVLLLSACNGDGISGGGGSTGSLRAVVATSGGSLDPDGYRVSLAGGSIRTVESNGSVVYEGLVPSEYTVSLGGTAGNCIAPSSSKNAKVDAGDTAVVNFTVQCRRYFSNELIFDSEEELQQRLHTEHPDGTGRTKIETSSRQFGSPDVSPDGYHLVARGGTPTGWAIFTMNADGSDSREIAHVGTVDDRLRWSPDGTRIAFSSYNITPSTPDRIWVVNVDGTNPTQVTTDTNGGDTGTSPSWFPDSQTLLFNRGGTIARIRIDGSGYQVIKNCSCGDPDLSPDGTRIVLLFDSLGKQDLYVMSVNGSDIQRVTSDSGQYLRPRWSPDGSQVAFSRTVPASGGVYQIFVVDIASGVVHRVSNNQFHEISVSWARSLVVPSGVASAP